MYCTSPPIRHFTWTTSKQLKGLPVAVCRAKALTFTVFVSYFKTPSIASPRNWTCNIRLCSYVLYMYMYNYIACTADKTELLLSLSAKQFQNPRPGPPAVYRDSSMHHDWPVKKTIVDLPISMKENSKCISSTSLSLLGAQNKDVGTACSSRLLTKVKLCLQCRLSALTTELQ